MAHAATGSMGLSPRVRGNPDGSAVAGGVCGSIPASAGEPCCDAVIDIMVTVYPRECGGTTHHCIHRLHGEGLSPRVRGNLVDESTGLSLDRSIPASAGEPRRNRRGPDRPRVYPRECGGTHRRRGETASGGGLSPRVRGTLRAWIITAKRAGLSPRVRGNQSDSPAPPFTGGSIPASAADRGM